MNIGFVRDLDAAAREIHVFVLFGLEDGSDDLKDLVLHRFHAGFGVAGVCVSHVFLCFSGFQRLFRFQSLPRVVSMKVFVPVVYMTVVFMAVVFMTFVLKFRYFRSKNGEFFQLLLLFVFVPGFTSVLTSVVCVVCSLCSVFFLVGSLYAKLNHKYFMLVRASRAPFTPLHAVPGVLLSDSSYC